MKTFDLELRITLFGSIITWKVLLEDSTNDNQIVLGWIPSPEGFLFKKLPGFQIKDDSLEVFASCHGILINIKNTIMKTTFYDSKFLMAFIAP